MSRIVNEFLPQGLVLSIYSIIGEVNKRGTFPSKYEGGKDLIALYGENLFVNRVFQEVLDLNTVDI